MTKNYRICWKVPPFGSVRKSDELFTREDAEEIIRHLKDEEKRLPKNKQYKYSIEEVKS